MIGFRHEGHPSEAMVISPPRRGVVGTSRRIDGWEVVESRGAREGVPLPAPLVHPDIARRNPRVRAMFRVMAPDAIHSG
jgi:hypothetical protein